MNKFYKALTFVNEILYKPNHLVIKNIQEENQNADYGAGVFELNSKTVRFIGLGYLLGGQGAGIDLQLVHVAAGQTQETGGVALAFAVAAHDQGAVLGMGDLAACGNGAGGDLLAV